MASEGTSGAKINTVSSIIALAVIIGLNVLLLPLFGISGAAFALTIGYLAATLYLMSRHRVLGGSKKNTEEANART